MRIKLLFALADSRTVSRRAVSVYSAVCTCNLPLYVCVCEIFCLASHLLTGEIRIDARCCGLVGSKLSFIFVTVSSLGQEISAEARRGKGWKPVQVTDAQRSEKGPGARLCCMFSSLSVVSLSVDCTN